MIKKPTNFVSLRDASNATVINVRESKTPIEEEKVIRYSSFGECIIADWLRKHSIDFEQEKEFKGLNNPNTGRRLRMDFYLPKIRVCIEFDGKQHFVKTKKFHIPNVYILGVIQNRDRIKNEFCIKNKIYMLRIKYDELHNIEFILCRHFLR